MRRHNRRHDCHGLVSWYLRFRKDGEKPKDALQSARVHYNADKAVCGTLTALSPSSWKRIDRFVDDFIRGSEVESMTSGRDNDFINEPERASRCWDAAEHGADGKTHSEVIDDWKDAFSCWMSERRRGCWPGNPERFERAVLARFESTELWHAFNGSLHQEIG